MSSWPASPAAPSPAIPQPPPAVAVVVMAPSGTDPGPTIRALGSQMYPPTQTLVVGGASGSDLRSPAEVVGALSPEIALVWWIHGDIRPRPDALRNLVDEMSRTDAAVAGSKILVDGNGEHLEAVGGATDVFGDVYTGLDPDELDLEQYDVVREVAYVSAVSLLVRRDLLRGLRAFDPALPPQAASIDFCQRARVAGGKVVVVPSSEVFHRAPCQSEAPGWKEQGGRNKAMLVAYSLLTLTWVVPIGALIGLADGIGQLVLGRLRPLASTLVAWFWTAGQIPSVVAARTRLRPIRVIGDEELFRFQVSGSSRMRRTLSELGDRFTSAIDEEEEGSWAERARAAWTRPSAGLSVVSVIGVLLATRSIWLGGPPEAAFSLPPSGASGLLASYGGGPNPAGFGSDLVVPPVAGLGSIAYLLLGRRPNLAAALLLLAAVILALVGMARLVRRVGGSALSGFLAGWVYVAGATTAAVAGSGNWPALLAAGPLPWALEAIFGPQVEGRRRLGRLAGAGLGAGLVAIAYPPLLAVVAVGGVLWALLARRLGAAALTLAATGLGALLILPYVLGADLLDLLSAGKYPVVSQSWLWVGAVALALTVAGLGALRVRLPSVWWAVLMAGGGFLLANTASTPPGVAALGLIAASLGTALLLANLAELQGRKEQGVALVAGAALLIPVVFTLAQGRLGLPADQWRDRLDFVTTLSAGGEPSRALLIGPPDSLPGASRHLSGFDYRTVDGGQATLTQAYLPRPGELDDQLLSVLENHLLAGVDLRPGAALAELGIEWLVIVPGSEFPTDILVRQLDLAARPVDTELLVFQNQSYQPAAPVPRIGTTSPMLRSAGWGSFVLLVVLALVAFWGRNRRRTLVLEQRAPEPVSVG